MTLHLRPFVDTDAAWMDGWFTPVAASVDYDGIDAVRVGASFAERVREDDAVRARVIVRDGADVGLVVYRLRIPRDAAAIVEIVATPPEFARRGSGMGALPLIEDELRAAGTRIVYAAAPAVHGIAVYFWIRLGYRPILRSEWPCKRAGMAWLIREL